MNWFYAKNGSQQGPLSTDEIKSRIAMGEVGPSDLAWREGMADWMPVGQIEELKSAPVVPSEPAYSPEPVGSAPASPYRAPVSTPAAFTPGSGEVIPNYLWQSIVVTLLCCWPVGIPAIVYAAKVEGLKGRGDFAAAKAASDNAKKWCIISAALGLVVVVIYIILLATGAMAGIEAQQGLPTAP